jgi:tetratricopeptide (TPR) repeat protein
MSSTDHPSPQDLLDHAHGRAEGAGPAGAAEHLGRGCLPCIEALRRALAGEDRLLDAAAREVLRGAEGARPGAFGEFAARLGGWAVLARAEEAAAPALAAELLALPAAERVGEIRLDPRFQGLQLAGELTRRARDEVFHDPSRADELGALAVEVGEALEGAGYPKTLAADALALAWAARGNALRVAADLVEAERAFRAARRHLTEGSGWATDEIELLSLLGSLRLSQTRYQAARRVLEQGIALAREAGGEDQERRLVLKLAKTLGEGGEPGAAVELLERSADLLDPAGLSHYRLQLLATALVEAGRPAEARAAFERARELLFRKISGSADRLRLLWLDARIAWAEGDRAGAEAGLRAVRDAFRDLGAPYDEALATLDLAALCLEEGRVGDVRRLAEEMLPVFTARALHRHALAALVLFQRSATAESLTLGWLRALIGFLHRARENPFLRFEPPV